MYRLHDRMACGRDQLGLPLSGTAPQRVEHGLSFSFTLRMTASVNCSQPFTKTTFWCGVSSENPALCAEFLASCGMQE